MTRLLVAVLLLAGCGGGAPPGSSGITALVGATVIDVAAGNSIEDAVVLVQDGRVLALGRASDLKVPSGSVIDTLRGRWIIPGLIDVHTHLQPWGMSLALRWGVTAVRDLHSGRHLADTLHAMSSDGRGPRLFSAVVMLDGRPPTYPDAISLDQPGDAAVAVDSLAAWEASWVKTYTRVTPPLLEAVLTAARQHGLPVAAHLGLTDARTAARLGVASIEHLTGIPEAAGDSLALFAAHRRGFFAGWTAFEKAWIGADPAALDAVARDLAATGVILVPTLGLHEIFARLDDSSVYHRAVLVGVPDSARSNWNVPGMIARAGWHAGDFADFRIARSTQDLLVRRFAAVGGRIATGTDASNQLLVPGGGIHEEMELLVAAGLSPLEALRAATLNGAALLGADSLGQLRVGSPADLVVLSADPLREITATRRIERVMLGGRWVRR